MGSGSEINIVFRSKVFCITKCIEFSCFALDAGYLSIIRVVSITWSGMLFRPNENNEECLGCVIPPQSDHSFRWKLSSHSAPL